jgi:hypothetical protein
MDHLGVSWFSSHHDATPYKQLFVTMTNLKNHATISLLDDWQNDYPLRGELGEQPDEWYEETGKGTAKL